MSQEAWDQQRRQHSEWLLEDLEDSLRSVPCQIDMDDLEPIPLTKDRALGLQRELGERLGSRSFQQQLRQCERTYGKSSLDFRREHQQLVLGVQSTVLPKYGYEASLDGVARMLKDFQAFSDDPEVSGNIEAIDSLIWKYKTPEEQRRVAPPPRRLPRPKQRQRQEPQWRQQQLQLQVRSEQLRDQEQLRLEWEHFRQLDEGPEYQEEEAFQQQPRGGIALQSLGSQAGTETGWVPYRGLPVELDMDDIHVPLEKEEALKLQKELLDRLSSPDFQRKIRECADTYGTQSMDFRREHQQLVLEVQSGVLPKYSFEASLEGVARMREAVCELAADEEVAANIEDINLLIWSCGGRPLQASTLPTAERSPPDGWRAETAQLPPASPPGREWPQGDEWRTEAAQPPFASPPWRDWRPQWQGRSTEAEEEQQAEEAQPPPADTDFVEVGKEDGYWVVVGGRRWGGLAVRQGEQPDAEMEDGALAIGTVVKELEWAGSLLHFRKVSGVGPDEGWVRSRSRRALLVEPFEGWLPTEGLLI